MVATTKVYLFVCFLVLVIGVYFQRVPRLVQDCDWVNFQGAPPTPERYDYFLLALQWPPSFCNSSDKNQCREDVKHLCNFTIHGLWPERKEGGHIDCRGKKGTRFNDTKLPGCMNESWPNLEGDNLKFWRKEWNKHGCCIGLDQEIYFNKACALREIASLVQTFEQHGIHIGNSYSIDKYEKAIQNSSSLQYQTPILQCNAGRISTQQLVVSKKKTQQLVEVRLCVDKNGTTFQNDCTTTIDASFPCNNSSRINFPM